MGELSSGFPKVVRRFITETIYGIQARQSVHLTEIARSLEERISIKKTQYRLSRQLGRRGLWLRVVEGLCRMGSQRVKEETLLVLDISDIAKKYAEKMDAAGWESILLAFRNEFGGKVHIGDTIRQTDWKPWDITSVDEENSVGSYHMGEMQISIAGLTRFHGEPCVLIWFSMEGNRVLQNMETPQFSMDMKSTEYFRGALAASILDGHLVAMELWGPLPCVMKMGFGGKEPTEQPVGAIIQQVSMWEVPSSPKKKESNP